MKSLNYSFKKTYKVLALRQDLGSLAELLDHEEAPAMAALYLRACAGHALPGSLTAILVLTSLLSFPSSLLWVEAVFWPNCTRLNHHQHLLLPSLHPSYPPIHLATHQPVHPSTIHHPSHLSVHPSHLCIHPSLSLPSMHLRGQTLVREAMGQEGGLWSATHWDALHW